MAKFCFLNNNRSDLGVDDEYAINARTSLRALWNKQVDLVQVDIEKPDPALKDRGDGSVQGRCLEAMGREGCG